jgi:hemerythrin-like metal-binding protein
MSLLEWRDEFRIGIAEVDHEHQVLIGLINGLHAALRTDRSGKDVEEFLGEIFARISAHFALEEKDMQAHRYPETAAHKADHEKLLDDIRDIMDEQSEHGILDDAAFSARLAAWFGDHFRSHDAKLYKFLQLQR